MKAWAVLFWLLVWQGGSMLLASAYDSGHLLLASPIDTVRCLLRLAGTLAFWRGVLFSAVRIFGGFLLSAVLAVLLAALSVRYPRLRELLAPPLAVIKATPVVSFIILALLWLDARTLSLFISALMVFPLIYLTVLSGIAQTDRKLLEMAQVFRMTGKARLRGIYIPQVLPYFRSAASTALGLCWKAGIAAEVIGLSSGSIGERLYTAKVYFETPELFAWTAAVIALSVGLEKLTMWGLDTVTERSGLR